MIDAENREMDGSWRIKSDYPGLPEAQRTETIHYRIAIDTQ